MVKKFLKLLAVTAMVAVTSFCGIIDVKAEEQTGGCSFGPNSMTEDSAPVLVHDESYEIPVLRRGAITYTSVDKTYQIYIQNPNGSCSSTANIRITGYYQYNVSNNQVVDYSLSASVSYVPLLWKVEIVRSWGTIAGSSLNYSVNYRSYVDDPYSCTVGGGYWYGGKTFQIR